jgi:hypothetical protein
MNPLLIGRWQAYKFNLKKDDSFYTKGTGLLFEIHAEGKVCFGDACVAIIKM